MDVAVQVQYATDTECGGDMVVPGKPMPLSWHVDAVPDGYEWDANDKIEDDLWQRIQPALEAHVCGAGGGWAVHPNQRFNLTV